MYRVGISINFDLTHYMTFFIPFFINHQLIGYDVARPHSIPIYIVNQKAGLSAFS
jgi:hypothetical protein